MTHPRDAPPAGVSRAGADAERATFLRDLRALRDRAGLGARDLAARAHFPEDTLITAEAGPALPSLPVLQAYVRGCGAGQAEWEDRWRRLNSDGESGGSALPTRAPSAARPAARMMPFPESTGSPSATEQEAIGFGLARVARGLAPADTDPLLSDGAGWFDPAPRPSVFTPSPGSSPASPPAPAPAPAPEVNPGAPTMQYPALSGYGTPEPASGYATPETAYPAETAYPETAYSAETAYPEAYTTPSYQPPEEFRTPVPEPPSPPSPAPPGPSATLAGLGTTAPAGPSDATPASPPAPAAPVSSAAPRTSGTSGAAGTSGTPKAHAAPASPRRRTTTWVVVALIALLIIAAGLWLVLGR